MCKAAEGCRTPRRWRAVPSPRNLRQVLECGSPLPLSIANLSMALSKPKRKFCFGALEKAVCCCEMKARGTVYLVGAGPGDTGLLTLRGAELLGRADVVVYDGLVNPELLRLAPKSAEIIYGGKRAKDHALPQEDLNQLLITKARQGKTVVRLKGGDPYVFGRGGEEAEQLADAGIRFEVVPGVSSFVAVPNYAGVPLTHRDFCSRLTLITGHEDPAKEPSSID